MKKFIYSVLALAAVVACVKEKNVGTEAVSFDETLVPMKIEAYFDAESKVLYEGNTQFGWQVGDSIKVRCLIEDKSKFGWYGFNAEQAGASSTFAGVVADTYRPSDYAIYPGFLQTTGTYAAPAMRVPMVYYLDDTVTPTMTSNGYYVYVNSSNPLQFLPNIGVVQEDGTIKFAAAYGVLNVNMTEIDAAAAGIRINSAGGNISNYLTLNKETNTFNIGADYVSSSNNLSRSYITYWFSPASDGTASLFVPMPVGTLSSGSSIEVIDSNGSTLMTQTFAKDVVIERGKISKLASFVANKPWISLGMGKFGDHYAFNPNYDQEVEIQQSPEDPNVFRMVNPYKPYLDLLKYEATGEEYGPGEYWTFRVVQKGEVLGGVEITIDDLVYFDDYYTGYPSSRYGVDPYYAHPSGWAAYRSLANFSGSFVVKYRADGTPSNVQIAPVIFWLTDPVQGRGYSTGANYLREKDLIQVVFPGEERIDLLADLGFKEIVDNNPEQAIASVSVVYELSAFDGFDIVIAASGADPEAAFAAGTGVVHVTTVGDVEVPLPANAPSGEYVIYGKPSALAEGLTSLCAGVSESAAFKYFNALDDKGFTIEDIVGSYTATNYYYMGGWTDSPVSMTMVVEESDDPLQGDIVITSLCPEIIDNFGANVAGPGLYGYFNTATGEISVAAGQILAHNTPNNIDWSVAGYASATTDLALIFDKTASATTIYNEGHFAFYAGEHGKQAWTNTKVTFIKDAAQSAPVNAVQSTGWSVRKLSANVEGAQSKKFDAVFEACTK